ncbi:MAG: hypothetical protein ACP5J4_15335 [Anaerolineae bacterium]
MTITLDRVTSILTEPFVRTGVYSSPEQALKHIFLDYIQRQINWAKVELRRYEQRHGETFEEWTQALSGKATIAEEDEWMEWEATQDMLAGWQQIKTEIEQRV